MSNRTPTPTAAWVKGLGAAAFGWGSYKHALVRAGVISSPDADCPVAYQNAFLRANRRPKLPARQPPPISTSRAGKGASMSNRTPKLCIWEDCDQAAIYCAGHAHEYMQPQIDELVAVLTQLAKEVALLTNEGDDQLGGCAYVDKHKVIRAKGSLLYTIERARAALAKVQP